MEPHSNHLPGKFMGETDEKPARQTRLECSAPIFALFSVFIKGVWTLGPQTEMFPTIPTEQSPLIGLAANPVLPRHNHGALA